jgi:hypothetical protein
MGWGRDKREFEISSSATQRSILGFARFNSFAQGFPGTLS